MLAGLQAKYPRESNRFTQGAVRGGGVPMSIFKQCNKCPTLDKLDCWGRETFQKCKNAFGGSVQGTEYLSVWPPSSGNLGYHVQTEEKQCGISGVYLELGAFGTIMHRRLACYGF